MHPSVKDVVSVYYTDILYDKKDTCFYLFLNDEYIFNPVTFPSRISTEDIIAIAKDMIDQYRNTCDLEELEMELKGQVPCVEFKGVYSKCDECPKCMSNTKKEDACMGVVYSLSNSFDSFTFKEITFKDKWTEKYGENSISHKEYKTKQLCDEIWQFSHICKDDSKYLSQVVKSLLHHCDENKIKEVFENLSNAK